MKADQSLDCMGLYCPMPIVATVRKFGELKVGEVLEVVADDKGIIKDMSAWAKATKHQVMGVEQQGEEIKVYVKKTH